MRFIWISALIGVTVSCLEVSNSNGADLCPMSGASQYCCSAATPSRIAKESEKYQFHERDKLCYGLVHAPHAASKMVVAGIVQQPVLTDQDLAGPIAMSLRPSITDKSLSFHVHGASLSDGSYRVAGDLAAGEQKTWTPEQFVSLGQTLRSFDFIAFLPAETNGGRPLFTPVVLTSKGRAAAASDDIRITLRSDEIIGELRLSFVPRDAGSQPGTPVAETTMDFVPRGPKSVIASLSAKTAPSSLSIVVRLCTQPDTDCVASEQPPSYIDVVLSK